MVDTAKSQPSLYVHEEAGEEDYEIDMDQEDDMREDIFDQASLQNELLFVVQGLGSIEFVDGYDRYVKKPECEESLKDLVKMIKRDGNLNPFVRQTLASWGTFEQELIPLAVIYKMNKKLSFLVMMLFVQLTQPPHKDCQNKDQYYRSLRAYK